jgi:hypothetical protein
MKKNHAEPQVSSNIQEEPNPELTAATIWAWYKGELVPLEKQTSADTTRCLVMELHERHYILHVTLGRFEGNRIYAPSEQFYLPDNGRRIPQQFDEKSFKITSVSKFSRCISSIVWSFKWSFDHLQDRRQRRDVLRNFLSNRSTPSWILNQMLAEVEETDDDYSKIVSHTNFKGSVGAMMDKMAWLAASQL